MKRILVFLGLKIAEIVGVFGVFALLSYAHILISLTTFGADFQQADGNGFFEQGLGFWGSGFMGILELLFLVLILVIIFIAGGGFYLLIKKNWDWSWSIIHKEPKNVREYLQNNPSGMGPIL